MSGRPERQQEAVKKDLCSSAVFLLFSLFVSVESYRLGLGTWQRPGAGYFPFAMSVALGFISLSVLVRALVDRSSGRFVTERGERSGPIRWRYIVLTVAGMLVYVAVFEPLGFALSTFLIMAFLVRVVGRATWRVAAVTAISIALASYLLFDIALNASLPKGILADLM